MIKIGNVRIRKYDLETLTMLEKQPMRDSELTWRRKRSIERLKKMGLVETRSFQELLDGLFAKMESMSKASEQADT